ncbi:hypothetical protein [Variovorax saccharolyticus]|uniref:hypothetical protein n=1 Tax=Variovorax saccharolyticus TaxID=3053516 RepID=UPI0025756173|nr:MULTISPECIES: hypothetical protein [unclassified Variovorax]MDM0022643.1 hypothetical protein [Variovorax sp. J22R187]MDM0029572.1 hypothetical protein [Variovorax sp. J31P216]
MPDSLMSPDGLRYVKKVPGSAITAPHTESKMSCFKCGRFVLRAEMSTRRFLGKNHLVCAPRCG